MPTLLLLTIAAGILFDFINGFHDAANAIATVVATRVLRPPLAVCWAALFNIFGFFCFGTAVAGLVGNGLIDTARVTPLTVLCGLVGAASWNLVTWRLRLPSSSSHALVGAYAGAAACAALHTHGLAALHGLFIAAGWLKIFLFMILAPVLGALFSGLLRYLLEKLQTASALADGDAPAYRHAQLFSSACLSLMHGGNDAQKTAGILAGALAASRGTAFAVPDWILALCYLSMGLGTLFGGWRIVRTMGARLTRLTPRNGVCAECGAALSILCATLLGLPVSTTHVTTGAIVGTGLIDTGRPVHWPVVRKIAWGWLTTIPMAALLGGLVMLAALKLTTPI